MTAPAHPAQGGPQASFPSKALAYPALPRADLSTQPHPTDVWKRLPQEWQWSQPHSLIYTGKISTLKQAQG